MSATGATLLAKDSIDAAVVERVVLHGDLRQLTPAQKLQYYNAVCSSLGLNPLTQPFAYITLNGKEVLYAKRDAAEQLRKVHNISIDIKAREVIEGVYVVTAAATMPTGRRDESTGAVAIEKLQGENRANAMLKAETKAKRRVTLSICGLGMLDETEVESIQQRPPVVVETPKELPSPPAGALFIKQHVESVTDNFTTFGKFILSDGREVVAKGAQLVAFLEQCAQEGTPLELVIRTVKRRGSKETYDLIEEAVRWKVDEPDPVDVPAVAETDQPF